MSTDRRDDANQVTTRLQPEHQAALSAYAARAAWPDQFQIYARGDLAEGVFVVASGRVVLRSHVRGARGFVPWIATAGETFGTEGMSPSGAYATDARADGHTETLFLSATQLRAFVREQPVHMLALLGQIAAERTALLERLHEVTTLTVEARLVAALPRLAMEDTADGRRRIEMGSATSRLLCEMIGATRESVSLALSRLAGNGLVERDGQTLYVASAVHFRLAAQRADVMLPRSVSKELETTTHAR